MKICVIGAGVVGVTTAYDLARRGHDVQLVDAHATPAQETSFANGGQLSYSYVAPLASPDVWATLPAWLLRRDSPLRLIPRADPHQWRWTLAFALACTAHTARVNTAALLALSYLSRDTLDQMLAETPIAFHHVRSGKLVVFRDPRKVARARALVDYQSGLGASQTVLDAGQTIALEPALEPMRAHLAGAVHTPGEAVGDCRAFTQALFDQAQARHGVRVHMGVRVRELVRERARIVAARTDAGDLQADAYVLATCMHTRTLLHPLGQSVPLYPLKGYSLDVALAPEDHQAPHISVTDYERRTVYARIGSTLRVAAMVDIGARDAAVDPERIDQIKQQVRQFLPHLPLQHAHAWAGMRPATPTGKPLIGRSPGAANLWLNVGQGALGFTLACGSARLLSTLMAEEMPPIDPTPFAP